MTQAIQSVGGYGTLRMQQLLGEGFPCVALTDILQGPSSSGVVTFAVPAGITTVKCTTTWLVTATSGPEVVGDAETEIIRFTWKNLAGTPVLMPNQTEVPHLAGSSDLSTAGVTAGVSGNLAQITYPNPSTVNASTVIGITMSIVTEPT